MGRDRRLAPRFDVDAIVEGADSDRRYLFRTRDLSESGLFLYTQVGHIYPFDVGDRMPLELRHRDASVPCTVQIMRVVRAGKGLDAAGLPGFGCRFVDLDDGAREVVAGILDQERSRARLSRPLTLARGALVFAIALALLVVYGLGFAWVWLCARRDRAQAVARWRGRMMRRGATMLGATAVKLGQVMSTRPDLLAPEIIDQLRLLQDRVPPFDVRRVLSSVELELGKPLSECFTEFDHEPVAAASTAQVHRARLPDGTEVAIKLLRPNVRRQIERDGVILMFLARVVALRRSWRQSDPVGHLQQFVNAVRAQTDLLNEAANYAQFRENFAAKPLVEFPLVFPELSTPSMLTMEFVHGTKIDALTDDARARLCTHARDMVLKMCLEDGFMHADLHPGNLLVHDDGTMFVFDCGLANRVHDDILVLFVDLARCLALGTARDMVEHFRRFHPYLPDDTDWDGMHRDLSALHNTVRGRAVHRVEMGGLISGLLGIMRSHSVRPTPELAMVFVAIITVEGIHKQLDPDANLMAEVGRYLAPLLRRRPELIAAN